ncbi:MULTISPECIES: hypothetical protein [Stenotrophomonas maltophilia group]|uniref:hypothetical protein n=1 Tax=Stenotrophomonas maltophilia group TaxID=995085 RepID=UPI0012FDADE3|nr:hypothetical protein [Stenotrophomonas maltophilia]
MAKNKIPMAAKAMIEQVAMGLGGAERMLTWVQEDPANEKAFWTAIYPKLLPLQVQGDKDNPLVGGITVTLVKPEHPDT